MRIKSLAHLTEAQRPALDIYTPLIRFDQINQIMDQGPRVLYAHVMAFMRNETTLILLVHEHVASAMPTRYNLEFKEEPKALLLILCVKTIERKRGRELISLDPISGMAMGDAMLRSASQHVRLAICKLSGRDREWTSLCNAYIDAAFLTWDSMCSQKACVFSLPNPTYHVHS